MLERLSDAAPEVVQLLTENPVGFELAEGAVVPPTRDYLNEQLQFPGQEMYVARVEGRVAALVMTAPHPRDAVPWIGFLLVDEGARKSGLGRRVVDEVERLWRARGARTLQLGVLKENEAAVRFWQRLGFVVVDERPSQPHGRMCWVMSKEIVHG